MSDESDNYEIDEDIDSRKHDKLVDEILNLNKIQNVKKPSRTEPTVNISEFNLVKSVIGDKGSVHLNSLTKVLKGRKKHEVISQRLKSTNKKSKTLPTPLEKPQAERIRRVINYEKSRLEFDRWEALVTSNRAADQLTFPLNSTEKLKIEAEKAEKYPSTWRIKSELQTELEKLEPKVEEYHINQEVDKFPLTLEKLKERRKEAVKLRMHQNYKEAKARRQNKIKSKKYHRILKREKIKKKLKEFEELQKTDPEEALKKLEDIEKARAEERFSLRHKGTGQWARNKQIRAKYDKETRQVLAQQLAISRDLTQKVKNVDSDSEEENIDVEEKSNQPQENEDNPWVSGIKPSKEMADFVSGYRKYWNDNKKNEENGTSIGDQDEESNIELETSKQELKSLTKQYNNKDVVIESTKNKKVGKTGGKGKKKGKGSSSGDQCKENTVELQTNEQESILSTKQSNNEETIKNKKNGKNELKKKKVELQKDKKVNKSTSEWEISLLKNGNDVEDIFNKLEDKLEKKVKDKYRKLKVPKVNKKKKTSVKEKTETKKADLSFPLKAKKPIIDEQMIEEPGNNDIEKIPETGSNPDINKLKDILETVVQKSSDLEIPEEFKQVKKTTNLKTAIPDISTTDENEEGNDQREIFQELFEDDDIGEDFKKEKENEVKKDTPGDIDLNLPGWGSWSGSGIKTQKRRKRFIIKMPAKIPRRDDNKGSLIINEKQLAKVKPHMVSEVPFPFKTVKDYEATMRAPIGNTFVPETAFRKLIEPSVITKMGAIIEPISRSILVGEKKV